MSAVSVIGLGAMGSALAAAFLNRGLAPTVWNRSAGKADALVAKGAVRASTPSDALRPEFGTEFGVSVNSASR